MTTGGTASAGVDAWAGVALRRVPNEVVVFAVALVGRLSVILRDGGLHGSYGYDGPVYFAASDALIHGRLPYRDFVFLHPPGLILALTPFASLTHLFSDETTFTIANLAFTVLGALNAVLVVRICRALGLGRLSATLGGLYYATSFDAIGAEYLTKLEPLGNALFLLALLLVLRAREHRGGWSAFAAGLCLGASVSVKIWWIVPVIAVLLWWASSAGRARLALTSACGAALAALAINLPFFAAAPHAMYSNVIVQQVGRQPSTAQRVVRIVDLTSVTRLRGHLPIAVLDVCTVLVLLIMAGAVASAWQLRRCRPVVLLLALQLAVLIAAPSFFYHYADYPSGAAAITVGAAAAQLGEQFRGRRRALVSLIRWAPVMAAAAVSTLIVASAAAVLHPTPGAASLARSVRGVRCVMSDTPMTLIELDALSRGLSVGCRNWIDVTGRTYGPDKPVGKNLPRSRNKRWQRDLTAYLRSGQAVIIGRRAGTGVSPGTQRRISRDGVLARAGGQVVYRVRH